MGNRQSEGLLNHRNASRECLVHRAEAAFAFKTARKYKLMKILTLKNCLESDLFSFTPQLN